MNGPNISPNGRPYSDIDRELFDAPFNLAGESQSSELTSEGQARAKAEADAIARKAQLELEPRITRNDIKTTGERIPYFGHMRKRKH